MSYDPTAALEQDHLARQHSLGDSNPSKPQGRTEQDGLAEPELRVLADDDARGQTDVQDLEPDDNASHSAARTSQGEATRHTLSVLVDNEAGVLSQVTRMFSRKGHNIESLAVGTTTDAAVSRITIEVVADDRRVQLLCDQLRKLLPVHSVKVLNPAASIRRELVLLKVRTPTTEACNRAVQIANIFRASVIDVSPTTITIALIGEESKTDAIVALLEEFGIMELVRTGIAAIERGTETIYDQSKERDEYDLGKRLR